ncbi:MAG: HlyD family efflux transporter periplasmic adaptor subunit [Gammaproteobacteria bacterium]|nr:MAG: HlyD family efflux transporter periplasmic adaptor subunit [Gammaproteobacteria bacterium]
MAQRSEASADRPLTLDAGLWASFLNARDDNAFLTSWLALLLTRIPGATCGVLMQADAQRGALVPAAIAPDPRRDLGIFQEVIEKVARSGRPAVLGDGPVHCAYPVRIDDQPLAWVVAVALEDPAQGQTALRELHWAAGWLNSKAWQAFADEQAGQLARAGVALDLLALMGEQRRPEAAAMAVVNELQSVMNADQIAIGMIVRRHSAPRIRLLAISYSAWFRKRSRVAEGLETAMEEAYDQRAAVAVPSLPTTERAIAFAHRDYVAESRMEVILSVPLLDQEGPVGVISAARRSDTPFTEEDRRLLEAVAALIGPVLELKRRNRRWFGGRIRDALTQGLGVLLGPRRLSWKLLALAVLGLGVAAATVQGPFRIGADAVVRGEVVRAAAAPFNGFIESAAVRAGDEVAAGDELARLDSADLELERLRWSSERDRLKAELRDAQAQHKRAQIAFLEAQIAQAEAKLALARTQLERTHIRSPIDGRVVSGDLSQRLGAPVQLGEVLFEIAPLRAFRLDIFVDERDMRYVEDGQAGQLALTGRPDHPLPFEITRITPVAQVRNNVNTFRVEARLKQVPEGLRPGMEGVAKIDVGEELLVWVWSRRLIDWLRETAWTWQP